MRYLLFLLLVVTIPGCADRRSPGEFPAPMAPPKMEVDKVYAVSEEPVIDEVATLDEVSFAPPRNNNSMVISERKLIKTGTIDFEVSDIDSAKRSINELVKASGGYTSSEDEQHGYGGPRFEQVVRIPSDKLDGFVLKIAGLAKRITSKYISTKDVSEEFIDLEMRLITKKDLEKNYREILRKAKTVKEMLEVERELEDVRGQIESMEGRLQYLKSQVAFSILTITYFQDIPVEDEMDFSDRVAASLGNGWYNVTEFVLDAINAWPALTVGSIAALIMYLRVRNWIRRRRLATSNIQ